MKEVTSNTPDSMTITARLALEILRSQPHLADVGDRIRRLVIELDSDPLGSRPEHERLRFLQRLIETAQYFYPGNSNLEDMFQSVLDLLGSRKLMKFI